MKTLALLLLTVTLTLAAQAQERWVRLYPGDEIIGPAEVHLFVGGHGAVASAVVKVSPVHLHGAITSAPLPAGVGARVTLEQSGDLTQWEAIQEGDQEKSQTNRFYRVRVILNPQ